MTGTPRALMPDYLRLVALFGIAVVNVQFVAFSALGSFADPGGETTRDAITLWLVNGLARDRKSKRPPRTERQGRAGGCGGASNRGRGGGEETGELGVPSLTERRGRGSCHGKRRREDGAMGGGGRPGGGRVPEGGQEAGSRLRSPSRGAATGRTHTPGWARDRRGRRRGTDRGQVRPEEGRERGTSGEAHAAG